MEITEGLAKLRDATARDVMTPRVDVVALASPVKLGALVDAVRRSGRSHYPVYVEDLDRLIGVLYVKDVFTFVEAPPNPEGARAEMDVTDRRREPYVVPESRSALEILSDMRRQRRGFAVVVDEYGGIAGVLTINDLVSELVGDLPDEFDRSPDPEIARIDANRYLVNGSVATHEISSTLGVPIPEGEYVTLAGYVLDGLGHVPTEGEVLEVDGWRFRVLKMDRHRIAQIVVEAPTANIEPVNGPGRQADGK